MADYQVVFNLEDGEVVADVKANSITEAIQKAREKLINEITNETDDNISVLDEDGEEVN